MGREGNNAEQLRIDFVRSGMGIGEDVNPRGRSFRVIHSSLKHMESNPFREL